MADRYLLESAIPPVFPDGLLLEDDSGVLLLEDGAVAVLSKLAGPRQSLAGKGGGLAG